MFRLACTSGAAVALAVLAGCASYPAPVQRMADAEAAARSAEDTGAAANPQGQLHLKLAQEGIAQAKSLMQNGDNERADYVLIRAKSDAELALAEAREQHTSAEAQRAMQKVSELQAAGAGQATSTTTTTSAVTTAPVPAPPPPPVTTSTSTTTTTQGGKP